MTFGASVKTCLSKYATFSGRASRSEYWWFYLFQILAFLGLLTLDLLFGITGNPSELGPLDAFWFVALFLPNLAVTVRRYHDSDFRGWWLFVPVMNFVLLFLKGTKGDNRYGPDPLQTEGVTAAGPDFLGGRPEFGTVEVRPGAGVKEARPRSDAREARPESAVVEVDPGSDVVEIRPGTNVIEICLGSGPMKGDPERRPSGGVSADALSRLEQLADLRDRGVLSHEEFAAQKAKILGS